MRVVLATKPYEMACGETSWHNMRRSWTAYPTSFTSLAFQGLDSEPFGLQAIRRAVRVEILGVEF